MSVCRCCLFFSSCCSASVWFTFTNWVIPVLFKTRPYYRVPSPPPPLHTALFVWRALSHQCVKYAVKNSTQTHWQFIPSWLWLPCGKWSESLWSFAALLFHRPTQWVFLWSRAGAGSRDGSPRVKAELQENASVTALKQEAECLNAPSHNSQDCSGLWDVIDCKI